MADDIDKKEAHAREGENLIACRRTCLAYRDAHKCADAYFEAMIKAATRIERDRGRKQYDLALEKELRLKGEWLRACETATIDRCTALGFDVFEAANPNDLTADLGASIASKSVCKKHVPGDCPGDCT